MDILSIWYLNYYVDLITLLNEFVGLLILILGLSWGYLLNNFQQTL